MSRAKETPKPLQTVKAGFYASLDAHMQAGLNLLLAVEFAVAHGELAGHVAEELKTTSAKFRAAMSGDNA